MSFPNQVFRATVWSVVALGATVSHSSMAAENVGSFLATYCYDCHNTEVKAGDLVLSGLSTEDIGQHSQVWERVVRKLRSRQMPPADATRPDDAAYETTLKALEEALDRRALDKPNPGRTQTFRRLTRAEYQNVIRDLLAVEIDAAAILPADDSSMGFDNITAAELSPTLFDRYLSAAQRISRLALGTGPEAPDAETIRLKPDLTQEKHLEGLPLGTRGGVLIRRTFGQEGEYEIHVRLARDRNEEIEGLREQQQMEILVDRRQTHSFNIVPPKKQEDHQTADAHLKARVKLDAGPHAIGVTFVSRGSSLLETKRQPYDAHFNVHRHPRQNPAVYQVSIVGPFNSSGASDSPSRRAILGPGSPSDGEELESAKSILAKLTRRAYRRPVTDSDLETPLNLYRNARETGSFDSAIELALASILVHPEFLFRIERDPENASPGTVYRVSDIELASRLSFFLWSSIPDEELLAVAERGELSQPGVLDRQVRRMLADARSNSLVTNFADQWLHLRNLDSTTPDLRQFPDFDENLRLAMRRETELLFGQVVREDRSVLELLESGETFLNERLAKHYGVPHVYGSRFRVVSTNAERGGLLRHGSILAVTSYATRTSPVLRGKWILENLLGTPPPPPPANVPALKDNTVASMLTVRERLAEHRDNAACAGCHQLIDPPGFSLENFDSVGRWRDVDSGKPVDAMGGLPDGSQFSGVDGLEKALLERPELFVGTLTEKLMTFALGRGLTPDDGPAVRQVVRQAKMNDNKFSSVVSGIVNSAAFQMRKTE